MLYVEIVRIIADLVKEFDSERPVHKAFSPGTGPFDEPQLVREIVKRLLDRGIPAHYPAYRTQPCAGTRLKEATNEFESL